MVKIYRLTWEKVWSIETSEDEERELYLVQNLESKENERQE